MTQHYRIRIRKNEIEIDVECTDVQFVQAKLAELKEEFLAKGKADFGYALSESRGYGKKESSGASWMDQCRSITPYQAARKWRRSKQATG